MWMRFLTALTVQTAACAAFILIPAWAFSGDWHWPRGWITLAILFVSALLGGVWFTIKDPGLVRERASLPQTQTRADGLATALIGVSVLAWFIAIPADVFRLHLLAPPPPAVSLWGGLAIYLVGLALIVWMFQVNSFAAAVVKIQSERDQRVIDTGPYALVRHPMYLGAILFFAGMALMMESPAIALIALPLFALAFLPRMLIEEATLRRDLPGYAAYQARVRARIVPGLL